MGCCFERDMDVDAPDEVIPDPSETDVCTFTIKQAGMASRDYTAYRGDSTANEDKWFVLNKSGPKWGGQVCIEVENFTRLDENAKNKGQVLWRADFQDDPRFEQQIREPGMALFEMTFNGWMDDAGGRRFDDDYYEHRVERVDHDYMCTLFMNWTMHSEALLTTTMRKGPEGPLILGVFARGTALARYYEVGQDDEGEPLQRGERTCIEKDIDEYVDCVQFAVLNRSGPVLVNGAPCVFTIPGDATDWTNSFVTPFFTVQQDGGWFTEEPPRVETLPGIDPTLALLLAHLMTKEYSAASIKESFHPDFPDDPAAGIIWGLLGQ